MEKAISADKAKGHFPKLLLDVAKGQSFIIMSCGRPIARVLPVDRQQERRSVEHMLKFVATLPVRHANFLTRDE